MTEDRFDRDKPMVAVEANGCKPGHPVPRNAPGQCFKRDAGPLISSIVVQLLIQV